MGFFDKLLDKTQQAGKNMENEYARAADRVAYMSIEDVLRSCPPPNNTLRNPGQMKAYTEKIEEWVLDNVDEPDRIRDMARMLEVVYKKYR